MFAAVRRTQCPNTKVENQIIKANAAWMTLACISLCALLSHIQCLAGRFLPSNENRIAITFNPILLHFSTSRSTGYRASDLIVRGRHPWCNSASGALFRLSNCSVTKPIDENLIKMINWGCDAIIKKSIDFRRYLYCIEVCPMTPTWTIRFFRNNLVIPILSVSTY